MKYMLLFALMVCAALGIVVPNAAAQTGGWTRPFEVSPPQAPFPTPTPTALVNVPVPTSFPIPTATPDPLRPRFGSSWFSSIAVAPDDSVHIVWYSGMASPDGTPGGIDLLMYRTLRNGVWSEPNNVLVPAVGGYTVRNSIQMGRDGRLHVVFRSVVAINYTSAPWQEALSPTAWREPQRVTDGGAYYTELGIDSKNHLHMLWSEAVVDAPGDPPRACRNCSDLYYRHSEDGGQNWSLRINLSNSPDGENRPQIVIDSQDRLHVVWDEGVDWYAGQGVPKNGVYRRSDDGGKTWTAPVRFSLPRDAVQQTALALDDAGNPLVVYRSVATSTVYYSLSPDGGDSWVGPFEIPGVYARNLLDNDLDRYALAGDSAGRIHLIMSGSAVPWEAGANYRLQLLHLTWDGRNWSKREVIQDNGLYPEWPRMAISNGNELHVTWFTRSPQDLFQSERARYRVWYSSLVVPAPIQVPLPQFTPTPVLLPTLPPTPVVAPTPTPLPAEIADQRPPTGRPSWELPGLLAVGTALLPVLGVILLALAGWWLFNRRPKA